MYIVQGTDDDLFCFRVCKEPFNGIKLNMIMSVILAVAACPFDKIFALAALCSVTDAVYFYVETFVITRKSKVYNKFIIAYEVMFIALVAIAVLPKGSGDFVRFIILSSIVNVLIVYYAYEELVDGFKSDSVLSSVSVYNHIKYKLMQKHLKSLVSEVINLVGYTTHKSINYIKYEKAYIPLETLLKVESAVVLGENDLKKESIRELKITSYIYTTIAGTLIGILWAKEIVIQRIITHIALSYGYIKQLKADFAGKEKVVTFRLVSLALLQLIVMIIINKPENAMWVITVFAVLKTLSVPTIKDYEDLKIERKIVVIR